MVAVRAAARCKRLYNVGFVEAARLTWVTRACGTEESAIEGIRGVNVAMGWAAGVVRSIVEGLTFDSGAK